jgi:hypothetical protein
MLCDQTAAGSSSRPAATRTVRRVRQMFTTV